MSSESFYGTSVNRETLRGKPAGIERDSLPIDADRLLSGKIENEYSIFPCFRERVFVLYIMLMKWGLFCRRCLSLGLDEPRSDTVGRVWVRLYGLVKLGAGSVE